MNRAKIVAALAEASIYEISSEEFIKQIIAVGVTSYLIDIYNFTVIFKGVQTETYNSPQTLNPPILISLLKTSQRGEPLMIHLLKKEGITHYEVFMEDLRMVYYEESGKEKVWA